MEILPSVMATASDIPPTSALASEAVPCFVVAVTPGAYHSYTMRSLRTTRNARVFFAASRSLIASSRVDERSWLSGVAVGQSLPGQSAAFVRRTTASAARIMAARTAPDTTAFSLMGTSESNFTLAVNLPASVRNPTERDSASRSGFANAEDRLMISTPHGAWSAAGHRPALRAKAPAGRHICRCAIKTDSSSVRSGIFRPDGA